jgi:hypothetical protein
MRRIDGAVAAPNTPNRRYFIQVTSEFRRVPPPPRILGFEAGDPTGPLFGRFAMRHPYCSPIKAQRIEGTRRSAMPM